MSIGAIADIMKSTRTRMIEAEFDDVAGEFFRKFSLRDGDYIRFRRRSSDWKNARIAMVDSVYWNQAGGWTAEITIVPLLKSGGLGKTRSLMICINANGTGLRVVGGELKVISKSDVEGVS